MGQRPGVMGVVLQDLFREEGFSQDSKKVFLRGVHVIEIVAVVVGERGPERGTFNSPFVSNIMVVLLSDKVNVCALVRK